MRYPWPVAEETSAMRLRGEFSAMPGLRLTARQVARLLGIGAAESSVLLIQLEREGVLARTPAGAYRLASPLLA